MKSKIITVILGVLIISSIAVNGWQFAENSKQQEQAGALQSEINTLSETQDTLDTDLEAKTEEIDTLTTKVADLETTIQTLQIDSESLSAKLEEAKEEKNNLTDFEEELQSESYQNGFEALAKALVAEAEKEIIKENTQFQTSRNADVTIDYSRSIREQVAELGITYDPSRDITIADKFMLYSPVGDNWHAWNELPYNTYHYTRADYTDDPLYLAFAKAIVKQHDNRLADINQMKADGTYYYCCPLPRDYSILVYDEIAGIDFSDVDREYLLNMLSNLMIDYIESIVGADITWCQQFCTVSDTENINLAGSKYCIWMTPNRAGADYYER